MSQQQGFTLVELAIVLTILGLITGSILMGQSLVRSAEIRKVISDLQRFSSANDNFRKKYGSIAGDFPTATDVWGIRSGSTGSDATCRNNKGNYTGTCNGNGDNYIDITNGLGFERFLFWQHLALSGMIEGQFTGASNDATAFGRGSGINAPVTPLGSSFFLEVLYISTPTAADAHYFAAPYNANVLVFADRPLTPPEMYRIDSKIDDGMPATGGMLSLKGSSSWAPNCADGDSLTAQYNVSNMSKACSIHYILDY